MPGSGLGHTEKNARQAGQGQGCVNSLAGSQKSPHRANVAATKGKPEKALPAKEKAQKRTTFGRRPNCVKFKAVQKGVKSCKVNMYNIFRRPCGTSPPGKADHRRKRVLRGGEQSSACARSPATGNGAAKRKQPVRMPCYRATKIQLIVGVSSVLALGNNTAFLHGLERWSDRGLRTGANGQLRSRGHLRGPASPHEFPDQTG